MRKHKDYSLLFISFISTLPILIFFGFLIYNIFSHALPNLNWSFLSQAPMDAGRSGGIGPILLATGLMLVTALSVSLPISLGCAFFLDIIKTTYAKQAKAFLMFLDLISATPSIVFGLFGYAFFGVFLGFGLSILTGALTLAFMITPLLARTAYSNLLSIPEHYKVTAEALSLSHSTRIFKLWIPYSLPSLSASVILGLGRAAAETSALLFTCGYIDRTPTSLFDSARTISVHIYDLAMNVPGGESYAYSSAGILILFLFLLNRATMWLSNKISKTQVNYV